MIINCSLDVMKVNKDALTERVNKSGKKARYLNVTLLENRDGRDQYGNDGMVVQSTTKEERAQGKRGPILGNYKISGIRPGAEDTGVPGVDVPTHEEKRIEDEDVPF